MVCPFSGQYKVPPCEGSMMTIILPLMHGGGGEGSQFGATMSNAAIDIFCVYFYIPYDMVHFKNADQQADHCMNPHTQRGGSS